MLRHFRVVVSRSARPDAVHRYRFVRGERGLKRFDRLGNLLVPTISADRRKHPRLLSAQAGILTQDGNRFALSPLGLAYTATKVPSHMFAGQTG